MNPRRVKEPPQFWSCQLPSSDETERKTVLIVDDDERLRTSLVRAFQRRGWNAFPASGREEAIRLAEECSPDLATVDLRMPGESGLTVVRELRALDNTAFLLVLTGYGSISTAMDAVRLGADHYMSKPADVDQILAAFDSADSTCPISENDIPVPSLARVEWEHIQRVLNDVDGNISQAAKKLGLHRRSLQRKLAKYPPRV
jgi:two-component system response regulator RegA